MRIAETTQLRSLLKDAEQRATDAFREAEQYKTKIDMYKNDAEASSVHAQAKETRITELEQ